MDETKTRSTSVDGYEPFVDFKNLPDTSTPEDADNMNSLQIENKKYIDNNRDIPTGGTTGQVLGKNSDSDFDVGWINQTGGGADYDAAPVGAMFDYPSLIPPTGYKICDGSALSRTEYSELFSVIGTTYGSGDGSTTFNLPNRLGRLSIGYNSEDSDFNTLGKTGGSKTHTQTVDEMPSHNHQLLGNNNTGGKAETVPYGSQATGTSMYAIKATGGGQAMNIMNPYIVSCPIIKVTGTAILKGNVVDGLEDNSTTNAPSQRVVKETIGDLEQLQTTDKTSLVNAINELLTPQVLVKNKTINVNINSSSVRGSFTADVIDGYTLSSAQAVNVPSSDSNTINFNIAGSTVYWLVTRQGYSNSGNMIVRLLYVKNSLIS